MADIEEIQSRARRLLGDANMERLRSARVIVIGVGGVGSWCVESLVRSGVSHITIVDCDRVAVSNINRQLMATTETVGQVKVDALKAHLLTVNPDAEIDARREVFCAENAASFALDSYDYIIDCIDSLKDKALLIETATRTRARFYSSMGAALKLDPTRVQVAEFWHVTGCPLARALRQRFKKQGVRPARKFQCVYSDELLDNLGPDPIEAMPDADIAGPQPSPKARINGSLMHITAIFGLTLAGLVLKDLTKK
ncbi:MAG: tRNA threonylcarbamoyladenosine dehydratase [Muribaculaceae bacterium]|nr:tRNA threonylcarbamoyladenosine dehydratase [Muribaculaceae bacterium]